MFGTLLTYLSDHESDVFVVASANDISKLPPELCAAERFDGVFFLDLPGQREREQIWSMYVRKFGLDPAQRRPEDREWTGAEIRSCCRLAALLDVPLAEAATNIVPVAITAGEAVEKLRQWASGGACRPIGRGRTPARATGCLGPGGASIGRRSECQLILDLRPADRSRAPPRGVAGIGPAPSAEEIDPVAVTPSPAPCRERRIPV